MNVSGEPGTVNALYLGNFDLKLDSTTNVMSGDGRAENAAQWVDSVQGVNFADGGSSIRELDASSYGTDDIIATNDTSSSTYYNQDYFTDDTGTVVRIDAAIRIEVTITYDAGNGPMTKTVQVAALQMDNGDMYLYPSKEGGLSQTSLDNLGTISSLTVNRLIGNDLAGDELIYHNSTIVGTVICFTTGTMIQTPLGEVPVEQLSAGDLVVTMDSNAMPIKWIGSRHLDAAALRDNPHLHPITIRAGALGDGLPATDLTVSPQHRILVQSSIAARMFGQRQVLVAAKHLMCLDGIGLSDDASGVTYWHFLFDSHQIVFANNTPAESLFPGMMALQSLGEAARDEILELFPELDPETGRTIEPARQLVPGRLARKLADRHQRNVKPIYS